MVFCLFVSFLFFLFFFQIRCKDNVESELDTPSNYFMIVNFVNIILLLFCYFLFCGKIDDTIAKRWTTSSPNDVPQDKDAASGNYDVSSGMRVSACPDMLFFPFRHVIYEYAFSCPFRVASI